MRLAPLLIRKSTQAALMNQRKPLHALIMTRFRQIWNPGCYSSLTIEQMQNWIINVLFGMFDLKLKEKMLERKDVIEEIREYITKNFDKEISLKIYQNVSLLIRLILARHLKRKQGKPIRIM